MTQETQYESVSMVEEAKDSQGAPIPSLDDVVREAWALYNLAKQHMQDGKFEPQQLKRWISSLNKILSTCLRAARYVKLQELEGRIKRLESERK